MNKAEQCTGTKSTKQYVPLAVPLPALKIVTGVFLNCERTKTRKEESNVGPTRLNDAVERGGRGGACKYNICRTKPMFMACTR
jgi:hypothetical protein